MPAALLTTRLLSTLLFGVGTLDLPTYVVGREVDVGPGGVAARASGGDTHCMNDARLPPPSRPPLRERIMRRLRAAKDIYEGMYIAPYRATIYREYLRQHDAFMVMGFSDLLGVPNPIQFYMLEAVPALIDEFHDWHVRMGMEQAPDGGFRCC